MLGSESVWLRDELFFVAADENQDVELWKTDGSPSGTQRVKDIHPGRIGSYPRSLVATESHVFFTAYEVETGYELWASDGTEEGTIRLTDYVDGPDDSFRDLNPKKVGDTIVFASANTLWRSDGTVEGTEALRDFSPLTWYSSVQGNESVFFTPGNTSDRSLQTWITDGTHEGTQPLGIGVGINAHFSNGKLYYSTPRSPIGRAFKAFDPLQQTENVLLAPIVGAGVVMGTSSKDAVLFQVPKGANSGEYELWSVTPNEKVRSMAKFNRPLSNAVSGKELVFELERRRGLWRSDGIRSGTIEIDIPESTSPTDLRQFGSDIYFTASGVHYLLDQDDFLFSVAPIQAAVAPNLHLGHSSERLIFFGDGKEHQDGLWATDGTPEGTVLLNATIGGRKSGLSSKRFGTVDVESAYFDQGLAIISDEALILTDGSVSGTEIVSDLPRLSHVENFDGRASNDAINWTTFNDRVYFTSLDDNRDSLLWTAGFETPLKQLAYPTLQSVKELAVAGDSLFLSARSLELGSGLWKIESNSEQPVHVRDFAEDPNISEDRKGPEYFQTWDNHLLFAANNSQELWISNGTTEGTVLLSDEVTQERDDYWTVHGLGEKAVIISQNGVWVTDGTPQGTVQISELGSRGPAIALDDKVIFAPSSSLRRPYEVWVTDGTPDGTTPLVRLESKISSSPAFGGIELAKTDDDVFIAALKARQGYEFTYDLWKTDGTNVVSVDEDLEIGELLLTSAGDYAYLGSDTQVYRPDFWRTDGTTSGTEIVPHWSHLHGTRALAELNGYHYFVAEDLFHGQQIWRIPVDPKPGDADGNGVVNFADFLILSTNFGRSDQDVGFQEGDFDGDSIVSFADFLILSVNFGATPE